VVSEEETIEVLERLKAMRENAYHIGYHPFETHFSEDD
jgi:hypothetical protein